MSHSVVLVLLRQDLETVKADPEAAVGPVLAPFDENTEVPEYDQPCHCAENRAGVKALKTALAEFGFKDLDDLREKFRSEAPDETEEAANKRWKVHPFWVRHSQLQSEDPDLRVADPECEECKGSGTFRTRYNPRSRWDWYTVGGRWNGYLTGFNPAEMPMSDDRYWTTCTICGGVGKRNDGVAEANPHLKDRCNGCAGRGRRLRFPHEIPLEDSNVMPVALIDRRTDDWRPFAILTPDGEWHEQGRMGWWGIVTGEQESDDWTAEAEKIMDDHADCVAVVVDVHI